MIAVLACALLFGAPQANLDQRVAAFLEAFNNLDWPSFRTFFDPKATIFHPDEAHRERVETPEQFERAWRDVEQIRKDSGRRSPPYMSLKPADLRIELLSADVALVTFQLVSPQRFGRRTLVWKRYADGWKIVHLHASNLRR